MALIWPADAAVVVDTSVIINFNATGCAAALLRMLQVRVLAPDAVQTELGNGRAKGRQDAERLEALVADGLVDIVPLGGHGNGYFEELVIGSASDTLDDGEAATIACALERGLPALVDERKATRICAGRYPLLALGCTIDLFAHPSLTRGMHDGVLATAVFNALQQGRMRVFPQYVDWVLNLIGPERAALCRSLPRAARRGVWGSAAGG
jgi:predicted nucleic acid-binding protein